MPSDALLRIEGADQFRALAREFRNLEDGKELRKQLRKQLKGAGARLLQAEKQAVLALPSKGQSARLGRPSLRREVARATQLRIRSSGRQAGLMVWVNPRRMPPGKANLPGYMEGVQPFQRWRHPVFGDEDTFVQQPRMPWFYRTASRHEGDAQRAALRAVNALADEIENRRSG